MSNEIELKQLVNDPTFIENMNKAFSDLRADFELTMDLDKPKTDELRKLHVDIKNQLSSLALLSRKSSGTVCGLRGTGKTHLFLLARHEINSSLWSDRDNNLCIYLNMKRLCLPENFNKEVFNRAFSIFIYEELSSQLMLILNELKDKSLLEKLRNSFNAKQKAIKNNLEDALNRIASMIAISRLGNESLDIVVDGQTEESSSFMDLEELVSGINVSAKGVIPSFSLDATCKSMQEKAASYKENHIFRNYLNIKSVRTQLIELINSLNLDSITFYVDEWEKISNIEHCQEYAAAYIDRMLDNPLFFWISIVPHRGHLYCLDIGADLQHQINLDENLIYENSEQDRIACLDYFKKFINKRLNYYFPGKGYTYSLLFRNDDNLDLLVLASMGNTRDFGTMLLKCWLEYQDYQKSQHGPGRPYKYFSQQMVISAIKDNGDKKYKNIDADTNVVQVWNDIKYFCMSKKSSHFAIEERAKTIECLDSREFSELIYHRLLHLRKAHVPAKDPDIESKLSILAINYAATYNLHAQERKMSFIVDYKIIHDRVRRYIYDPERVLSKVRIQNGTEFPCISCKQRINPALMKHAWESNTCPFCGKAIHN